MASQVFVEAIAEVDQITDEAMRVPVEYMRLDLIRVLRLAAGILAAKPRLGVLFAAIRDADFHFAPLSSVFSASMALRQSAAASTLISRRVPTRIVRGPLPSFQSRYI